MLPPYQDDWFTFRFADDRIIPRFHLEGVEPGRPVSVIKIDPGTGERLGLLATGTVGEGVWVNLGDPIIVRAGDAFIAVPELVTCTGTSCIHPLLQHFEALPYRSPDPNGPGHFAAGVHPPKRSFRHL